MKTENRWIQWIKHGPMNSSRNDWQWYILEYQRRLTRPAGSARLFVATIPAMNRPTFITNLKKWEKFWEPKNLSSFIPNNSLPLVFSIFEILSLSSIFVLVNKCLNEILFSIYSAVYFCISLRHISSDFITY